MPAERAGHDQTGCISGGVAMAEVYCAEHKLQLTPVRRRVLELLLEENRAIRAYEILDRLKQEGRGSQPPMAYRALEFLMTHGFVHRIERLNAYVACGHPGESHKPAFMVCRICSSVAETVTMPSSGLLVSAARKAGFRLEDTIVEAIGVCPACIARGAVQ